MSQIAVVALGGNSLTRSGQTGTHAEQTTNARRLADAVCRLRDAGWRVVVVHGNGPQIGDLAIQQEEATARVPALPLHRLGAMTQGHLGGLLTLALHRADPGLPGVVALVTHVVVDAGDPAFAGPTKPIGPFFTEAQARKLAADRGWVVAPDAGRGFRRVVASPDPREIVELDAIRALVDHGMIVIAAGGGGVPVVRDGPAYRGVDAVVDKDLAAARLAGELGAHALVLVTDVEHVMVDFGTPAARPITEIGVDEAQRHADRGQFPEGSMGPKVRAAIRFLRGGGAVAVITNADLAAGALAGAGAGTRIVATVARTEVA